MKDYNHDAGSNLEGYKPTKDTALNEPWDREQAVFEDGIRAGRKEVIEWLTGHELIKPEADSLTQFEPFYQITQKEVEMKYDTEL